MQTHTAYIKLGTVNVALVKAAQTLFNGIKDCIITQNGVKFLQSVGTTTFKGNLMPLPGSIASTKHMGHSLIQQVSWGMVYRDGAEVGWWVQGQGLQKAHLACPFGCK